MVSKNKTSHLWREACGYQHAMPSTAKTRHSEHCLTSWYSTHLIADPVHLEGFQLIGRGIIKKVTLKYEVLQDCAARSKSTAPSYTELQHSVYEWKVDGYVWPECMIRRSTRRQWRIEWQQRRWKIRKLMIIVIILFIIMMIIIMSWWNIKHIMLFFLLLLLLLL